MEHIARLDQNTIKDSQTQEIIRTLGVSSLQNQQNENSQVKGIETEVSVFLKPIKNPLLKHGQILFVNTNFNEWSAKGVLDEIIMTPKNLFSLIKKRIEFTFDDYPLLTEDNKDSQKILLPILQEFCKKFNLKIFNVPAS